MKNSIVYITVLTCISMPIIGTESKQITSTSDNKIQFKLATQDDVEAVVALMNAQAYLDSDKIVIVPEKFRSAYVQDAVDHERLFVACHNKEVVGYKKLFCATDNQEIDGILNGELRCKGTIPAACATVSIVDLTQNDASSDSVTTLFSQPVTCIYNGADFTHPNYRGQSINARLTTHALKAASQLAIEHSKQHNSKHLALLYGLTHSNAGTKKDLLSGRSKGIVREFIPCAQAIAAALNCTTPKKLLLSRHHAFKPSFDPKATECKPLDDKLAIPGYGCVVACDLTPQKTAIAKDQ